MIRGQGFVSVRVEIDFFEQFRMKVDRGWSWWDAGR